MRKSEKAELISIVCSIFMAAAMIIAARLTGSVGVLAEGIDTVMDVVASLAVLAGMKLSERRTSLFPRGSLQTGKHCRRLPGRIDYHKRL